jgi:dTDP-3-amino-3,4,6-trideoxy-alpha-D-glucose transaminase
VRVPFGDLRREVEEIGSEVSAAIDRVMESGWFVLGEEVERFEQEFAAWLGVRQVVACGNGTDAITLALRALDLPSGAAVVTVTNTCVPSAAGIRDAGCSLRLVDCDPRTLQMDPQKLDDALSAGAAAVLPVHLFGSSPDLRAIREICDRRGVPMVEDCAQAHGGALRGIKAGTWGRLSAWSFYPSKNLGAYGDGGAVATDDSSIAAQLRQLRNYGQTVRYHHDREGRNSRLDEMQAAILRVKLRHLDRWNARRAAIAERYDTAFGALAVAIEEGCSPSRHLYPVRCAASANERDAIRSKLLTRGVATQIHYPIPIHQQKAYAAMFAGCSFPVAEAACNSILSLPLFPQLDPAEVDYVIDTVTGLIPLERS